MRRIPGREKFLNWKGRGLDPGSRAGDLAASCGPALTVEAGKVHDPIWEWVFLLLPVKTAGLSRRIPP